MPRLGVVLAGMISDRSGVEEGVGTMVIAEEVEDPAVLVDVEEATERSCGLDAWEEWDEANDDLVLDRSVYGRWPPPGDVTMTWPSSDTS